MALLQEAPRSDAPKTVLQTVDSLPTPSEKPQYPALRFYPNGLIDLAPDRNRYPDPSHKLGIEYQEVAMQHVDSMLPEGVIALGAHLLDAAILKTELAPIGRPDVIVFVRGELDSIYEFKRTWHTESGRKKLTEKLEKISLLLKKLRSNPALLGRLVQEATGQGILPYPVRIARDSRLKPLVFVSSSGWDGEEILTSQKTSLRGTFLMVPASNGTS